jgi:hypothetical protein
MSKEARMSRKVRLAASHVESSPGNSGELPQMSKAVCRAGGVGGDRPLLNERDQVLV